MNSMFLGRLRAVSLSSIALALGFAGATAPAPAFAAPVAFRTLSTNRPSTFASCGMGASPPKRLSGGWSDLVP